MRLQKDFSQANFYLEIEPKVRYWVYLLRNAGINTECSCEHEGYIQCQTLDPSTEIKRIITCFSINGLATYDIDIRVRCTNDSLFSTLEIRSEKFKE